MKKLKDTHPYMAGELERAEKIIWIILLFLLIGGITIFSVVYTLLNIFD